MIAETASAFFDDVDPLEAGGGEGAGLGGGVGVVDGRLLHDPVLQADAFPALEVDGRIEDHAPSPFSTL
jgi:hypothetical protein